MNKILTLVIFLVSKNAYADPHAVRTKWMAVMQAAAEHYELDWRLLDSVVWVESTWNPEVESPSGAVGLAQIMPDTATELGIRDLRDPGQNLWGAALYLKRLNDRFCNWRLTLAAYNAGPTKVAGTGRVPDIKETKEYVDKVVRRWDSIEADMFSSCKIAQQ